ncbi:peptide ABC transporter substrate-binding protein [Leuconostoc litchii]|uniref:Peptide ABC transporter substrate-binding protein n=1 Tax=Leuconostoc litchii TaxID=1981069 RepID=A0A652NEA2_9LACO|nr:peptide ABC transporter substrate-binding protein [Leuconostoc litchii]TYC46521.1 peptide ABC transporter substrate-binding protein [Leuconostoc litchii]GMA70160.1 peptide ABC transporter substrate-binding protein [Leuconostoc litchii]
MNKKIVISAAAVIIVAGIYATTRPSKSAGSHTLKVAVQNNISTLDPNLADQVGANWAEVQTLEGLYTTSAKGKIVPGIAKKIVEPSQDGKVYTIKLKKNQKWSDGSTVTAANFVDSVKRQVNPATKSTRANHFKDIAGYDAVYNNKENINKLGISAPDKYTVKIELSHPVPYFNFILANELYPINSAKLKEYGNKYGQTAKTTVSNGAYTIKKWNQSSTTWEFVKNKYYAGADSVHYDTIKATQVTDATLASKQYLSKKVDEAEISGGILTDLKKTNAADIKSTQKGRVAFIVWNATDKTVSNTNLKRALSLAINRKELTQSTLADGSTPAKSIVPSGEVTVNGKDFNANLSLPYDKELAQKYLKSAQSELNQQKITITLNTADTDAYKALGVYLKQSIEATLPDVTINLKQLPLNAEIAAFNNKDFQAGTLTWSTDYNDPIDFLDIAYSKGAINFTNWTNSDYEKLISDISNQHEANNERYELEQKAAKLNNELNGVTPLYQVSNVHLLRSSVKNLDYPLIGYQNYKYAK